MFPGACHRTLRMHEHKIPPCAEPLKFEKVMGVPGVAPETQTLDSHVVQYTETERESV
jgi:hypothetical protein